MEVKKVTFSIEDEVGTNDRAVFIYLGDSVRVKAGEDLNCLRDWAKHFEEMDAEIARNYQ